jgi:hypothetical protein
MTAWSPTADQPACEDVGSPAGPTLTGLQPTSAKTTKNRTARTAQSRAMSAPAHRQPASPADRRAAAVARSPSFVFESCDMPDSPEPRQGVTAAVRRRPLTASTSRTMLSPASQARRAPPRSTQQPPHSPWALVDLPGSLPGPSPANAGPAAAAAPPSRDAAALPRTESAAIRSQRQRPASSFPTSYGWAQPISPGNLPARPGRRGEWGPGAPPACVLRACFGSMGARAGGLQSPYERAGGPQSSYERNAPPHRWASAGLSRSTSQPVVRTARSPPAKAARRPSARGSRSVVASGIVSPQRGSPPAVRPDQTASAGKELPAALTPRPGVCDDSLPRAPGGMPLTMRIPTVGVPLRFRLETRGPQAELNARPSTVPRNTTFAAYVQPRAVQGIVARGSVVGGGSGPPPLPPERAYPAHITLLLGSRQKRRAGTRPAPRSTGIRGHATESPACAGGVPSPAPPTLHSVGF